jgi:uncharacterized membrane protein
MGLRLSVFGSSLTAVLTFSNGVFLQMVYLIIGLAAFFSVHLVRIVAPQWREAIIASMGEGKWKGIYTVISVLGLVLLIWGFGQARADAPILFTPPVWASHLALLLMAIAFILMMAGNLATGKIKQAVKHPFLASIKIWAFAHLLANGDLASAILFGSFLIYAVWGRIAAKRRSDPDPVAVSKSSDIISVVSGLVIWVLVVFWLHDWLIGVNPIA